MEHFDNNTVLSSAPPPPPPSSSSGGCFPSEATVQAENGQLIPMSELKNGDEVKTGRSYRTINVNFILLLLNIVHFLSHDILGCHKLDKICNLTIEALLCRNIKTIATNVTSNGD